MLKLQASGRVSAPLRHFTRTHRAAKVTGLVAAAAAATMAAIGPAAAATLTQTSANITNPLGQLLLPGADGLTHHWISDHLNGLCRLDPVNGQEVENVSTCVLFFGRNAIKPGQLSYDAANQKIYVPDLEAKSLGVLRFGYDPTANAGTGGISLFDRVQLAGNCGLGGNLPWGSALGPDGDLYIVGKKSPNILRIHNPGLVGSVSANCGADVQNIGNVADGKKGFQLAFIGHDLWENDGFAFGVIQDAVAKARPAGTTIVDGGVQRSFPQATAPQNATTVLVGVLPASTALTSDGRGVLYAGNATQVDAINVAGGGGAAVYSTGFTFTTSIIIDTTRPSQPGQPPALYVADDTSNGTFNNTGRVWSVTP